MTIGNGWRTLSNVSREHTAVRLSPAGLTRVRELAQAETEGNVSMMIRKLLAEAIAARDKGKR